MYGLPGTTKHNHANRGKKSSAYLRWVDFRMRCRNPKHPGYKNYGGRGIKVCRRWEKFENFLIDMGEPKPNQAIDRIDNNGHYCKNNCRWIDRTVSCLNRRKFKNNTSGYTGVQLLKGSRWLAIGFAYGKPHRLGNFSNFEEAMKARKKWEKEIRDKI